MSDLIDGLTHREPALSELSRPQLEHELILTRAILAEVVRAYGGRYVADADRVPRLGIRTLPDGRYEVISRP